MSLRVLVCDDNAVVRGGLVALLDEVDDVEVVGQAGDGREAIDEAGRLTPDVVLLDVRMPVLDGVAAAARIAPRTPVLMLTYSDEDEIVTAAVRAGASGYLVHGEFTPDELATAIRTVADGGSVLSARPTAALLGAVRGTVEPPSRDRYGLTPREAAVMDLVAQGLTNAQVAEQLFVARKTVKNHVNAVFAKLDVSSRSAAVARWLGTDEAAGPGHRGTHGSGPPGPPDPGPGARGRGSGPP